MREKSRLTPPRGANVCPSNDVPPPNGTTGTLWCEHSFMTAATSSVEDGETMTRGYDVSWWYELQGLPRSRRSSSSTKHARQQRKQR